MLFFKAVLTALEVIKLLNQKPDLRSRLRAVMESPGSMRPDVAAVFTHVVYRDGLEVAEPTSGFK